MTQLETLALQGHTRIHTGLASLDTSRLKRMRSQAMRLCFSQMAEEQHRMEFVARVRGMEFINDAAAHTPNATWYTLHTLEGPIIWIVTGDPQADYRRILPVAKEKVPLMICLGPNADDLRQAFGGVVSRIEAVDTLHEAVHLAYCCGLEGARVVYSPAGESPRGIQAEGSDFTREVNEL